MWTGKRPDFSKLSEEQINNLKGSLKELISLYDYNPVDQSVFVSLQRMWRDFNDEISDRHKPTFGRIRNTFKVTEETAPKLRPLWDNRKRIKVPLIKK